MAELQSASNSRVSKLGTNLLRSELELCRGKYLSEDLLFIYYLIHYLFFPQTTVHPCRPTFFSTSVHIPVLNLERLWLVARRAPSLVLSPSDFHAFTEIRKISMCFFCRTPKLMIPKYMLISQDRKHSII